MKTNLEYCSLHYLRQWLDNERHLHTALNSDDVGIIERGISDAVRFFMVARNLPRKFDVEKGLTRYEPLLYAFLSIRKTDVTEANYIEVIDHFKSAISEVYGGKSLISLSSKLLWLRYQDPFIIYDSRVRSTLKVPSGNYSLYAKEWLESFSKDRSEIATICGNLPVISRYIEFEFDEADVRETKEISDRQWFHKRVFDIYLWHLAGVGA